MSEVRQTWTGALGFPFEVSAHRIRSGPSFTYVAVSGSYDHHTAPLLGMIVAAALANPFGPGFGLILDLSTLEYAGGDGLLDWVYLATKQAGPEYFLCVIVSTGNRGAVTSLIADLQLEALDEQHFESLLEAEAALFSRWTATAQS